MSNEKRRHPNEELVDRLMLINEQLLRQLEATSALLISLVQPAPMPFDGFTMGDPQVFSGYDEVEEDAAAMLEDGLIDTAGYQEMLRKGGLTPTLELIKS